MEYWKMKFYDFFGNVSLLFDLGTPFQAWEAWNEVFWSKIRRDMTKKFKFHFLLFQIMLQIGFKLIIFFYYIEILQRKAHLKVYHIDFFHLFFFKHNNHLKISNLKSNIFMIHNKIDHGTWKWIHNKKCVMKHQRKWYEWKNSDDTIMVTLQGAVSTL